MTKKSDDQAEAQKAPAKPKAPAFVFIGDKDGHGPDEIVAFGLRFEKNGKPVEVEDKNAAERLSKNSHFKAA